MTFVTEYKDLLSFLSCQVFQRTLSICVTVSLFQAEQEKLTIQQRLICNDFEPSQDSCSLKRFVDVFLCALCGSPVSI